MKHSFVAAAGALVIALAGVPALAAPAPAATPSPGPLAYYIMMGSTIISDPYPDPAACTKELAKVQKNAQPGKDMIVCAHRRPERPQTRPLPLAQR